MDNEHLLKDAIAAFNSARDAGYELPECLRAVLNVAVPRDVSGPGVGIVSFVEPNPGEEGPESRCGTHTTAPGTWKRWR